MKGESGFEQFYKELYQDQWTELRQALLNPSKHIGVINPFVLEQNNLSLLSWWKGVVLAGTPVSGPGEIYFLDLASLLPVLALDLKEGEEILDLCAAPGGKSLMMIFFLMGKCHLTLNDRSPERKKRIERLMNEFKIPKDIYKIFKSDASTWGLKRKEQFDKILVDVPCSSERHVLKDTKELINWNIKRPKRLMIEQYAILASALMSLKAGGTMVYSTCSLNPGENDGVVEKLLDRQGDQVQVMKLDLPIGEPTTYGWRVLPSLHEGWGPFYLSKIYKLPLQNVVNCKF